MIHQNNPDYESIIITFFKFLQHSRRRREPRRERPGHALRLLPRRHPVVEILRVTVRIVERRRRWGRKAPSLPSDPPPEPPQLCAGGTRAAREMVVVSKDHAGESGGVPEAGDGEGRAGAAARRRGVAVEIRLLHGRGVE